MPSSLEDVNIQIIRLKKLKLNRDLAKVQLDNIDGEIDTVKQSILEALKEAKMLSIKTETGTASITRRKTVQITNEVAVKTWLTDNGWDLEDYLVLDKARTKPILENAVLKDGEILDGVSVETSEYLTLKSPKEDK